ncbi:MAG: LapA family protein [Chroococcales cyanobacterium]
MKGIWLRSLVVLALVIALITVIFALQNATLVIVNFFAWEFEASLALVLICTLVVGVVIGLLVSVPSGLRHKLRANRYRKRLIELENSPVAYPETVSSAETARGEEIT